MEDCAVMTTLKVMGGKWKPLIIHHLRDEALRYNELRRRVTGVTQRVLTLQLRQLEEDSVVRRTVHEVVPPKVEYALSDVGLLALDLMDVMHEWGTKYEKQFGKPARTL